MGFGGDKDVAPTALGGGRPRVSVNGAAARVFKLAAEIPSPKFSRAAWPANFVAGMWKGIWTVEETRDVPHRKSGKGYVRL